MNPPSDLAKGQGAARQQVILVDRWQNGAIEVLSTATSPDISCNITGVNYRCPSCQDGGRRAKRVEILIKNSAAFGANKEWVCLKTNHPQIQTVLIPLNVTVLSDYTAVPANMLVNAQELPGRTTQIITITAPRDAQLSLPATVITTADWAHVEKVERNENALTVQIGLDIPSALGEAAGMAARASVVASWADGQVLDIPIVVIKG